MLNTTLAHNFFLEPPAEPKEDCLVDLRFLYTPLIGAKSVTLYTFIFDECMLRYQIEGSNLVLTKAEIMEYTSLSSEELVEVVALLEQSQLLKQSLVPNDPGATVWTLLTPLSIDAFYKAKLFWRIFELRCGKKRAKVIKEHLRWLVPKTVVNRPPKKAKRGSTFTPRTLWDDLGIDPKQPRTPRPTTPSFWSEDEAVIPANSSETTVKPNEKQEPVSPEELATLRIKEKLLMEYRSLPNKVLWTFLDEDLKDFEVTPAVTLALEELSKTYPDVFIPPQLALALFNETEPYRHACNLLETNASTDLTTAFAIMRAEGFSRVAMNLMSDYAFSQNGVINTNFVIKISKNFVKQNFYDPLAIALHLRKAVLAKAKKQQKLAKKVSKTSKSLVVLKESSKNTKKAVDSKAAVIDQILKNGR